MGMYETALTDCENCIIPMIILYFRVANATSSVKHCRITVPLIHFLSLQGLRHGVHLYYNIKDMQEKEQ